MLGWLIQNISTGSVCACACACACVCVCVCVYVCIYIYIYICVFLCVCVGVCVCVVPRFLSLQVVGNTSALFSASLSLIYQNSPKIS